MSNGGLDQLSSNARGDAYEIVGTRRRPLLTGQAVRALISAMACL